MSKWSILNDREREINIKRTIFKNVHTLIRTALGKNPDNENYIL